MSAAADERAAVEAAIRAVIGEEILSYEYCYPQRTPIRLIFFRVPDYEGEPRNRQFADTRWEAPARLPHYDFVAGDRKFVRRLVGGSISFAAASPQG